MSFSVLAKIQDFNLFVRIIQIKIREKRKTIIHAAGEKNFSPKNPGDFFYLLQEVNDDFHDKLFLTKRKFLFLSFL